MLDILYLQTLSSVSLTIQSLERGLLHLLADPLDGLLGDAEHLIEQGYV
jgi:hypothetical protein